MELLNAMVTVIIAIGGLSHRKVRIMNDDNNMDTGADINAPFRYDE